MERPAKTIYREISPIDVPFLEKLAEQFANEADDMTSTHSKRLRYKGLHASARKIIRKIIEMGPPQTDGVPVLPLPRVALTEVQSGILDQAIGMQEGAYSAETSQDPPAQVDDDGAWEAA